jgi:hypothetical protein
VTDETPAWVPCEYCEEFVCTIHGGHVAECECPPIEEWECDPYARLQQVMDAAVIAALAAGGSRAQIAARHRITRNGLWKRTQWMR